MLAIVAPFATDELVLRAGVAKVISRPGYAKLAGSATLNELANTGTSGGNPYLDPFKATLVPATSTTAGNAYDDALEALKAKISLETLPLVVNQIASASASFS